MNLLENLNNVYNDIEVSVNKLNNNEELSLYDLFYLVIFQYLDLVAERLEKL